ncbi:hypothetical protein [Nodosilinea nodulosa]|uniref:hypothetical protein n=1 Tax=Nodosilinea nodulosa TaxID=416001 RepID=UPI000373EFAF|nr:hypothetical protein [Nodosilinea nodulosa]
MSQSNLPSWVPIVLGGGGLVGFSTILFNLFKQVTDAKDTRIENLEGTIVELEKRHSEQINLLRENAQRDMDNLHRELENKKRELSEMKDLKDTAEKFFDDLSTQEITPETRLSLRKIESLLANIDRNQEVLKSTKTAAEWVTYKKEDWSFKLVKSARDRYPDLIKNGDVERFRLDILKYLDWIYDSLNYGFTCKIEDYVRSPAIASPFPYRAAFQELAEINDFGQLSDPEVRDLQDYITELSRQASM